MFDFPTTHSQFTIAFQAQSLVSNPIKSFLAMDYFRYFEDLLFSIHPDSV
jgi:hypothetical protein